MERLTAHSELQDLLGAYALDALDPDEAELVERHLPTCPRCRNELADHREVAGLLGYAGGTAPGGVRDRIIASLEEPPPALRLTRIPPSPGIAPTPAPPGLDRDTAGPWGTPASPPIDGWRPDQSQRTGADDKDDKHDKHDKVVPIERGRRRKAIEMRVMAAVATAAAVIIVAAIGFQVGRHEPGKPQTPNLPELAYRVADADPNSRHLTLASSDGVHTVRAVIISDGTTYLGPGNLEKLPSDETYQMWGVVDGARVSLGVIGSNPTYHAFTTPAVAKILAMTVEPRGGVVSSTKTPVLAAVVPSA